MRAFFGAIVLLLFAVESRAFIPGPTIIRECPKCRAPIEQRTMASGNTYRARFWSDGKMGAPMLPEYPWLVKCPKCKHLFWVDEAKKLGDTEKGWKGQGKVASHKLVLPTVSDFCSVVTKTRDKEKQRYIRTHLWHCANDRHRDRSPAGTVSLSAETRANLTALSGLLSEKNSHERLTKAEIARELGQFEQCIRLLNYRFDKGHGPTASAIRMLAQEGYAPVMEFSRPERYQKPAGTADARPTDIENRLFLRAMKDSCVPVVNGLLARYSVDALLRSDPRKLKAAIAAGSAKGYNSAVAVVLDQAVLEGSADAVRFLLDGGAQVNGRSDYPSLTPLMTACFRNDASMVGLLIDRGADVNDAADFYLAPLGIACRERLPGLARLLLDRGARVDEGSVDSTPLMTLCTDTWDRGSDKAEWARKTLEMIRLLIDRGASVNGIKTIIGDTRSQFWSTPLTEVCGTEFREDEDCPSRYTKEEKAACQPIYLDMIRLLLDRGADVDKADYEGSTPLAHACRVGNVGAVKLLLERGADVNKAAKDGTTPLSAANKLPDSTIAKLLLEHGAKAGAGK